MNCRNIGLLIKYWCSKDKRQYTFLEHYRYFNSKCILEIDGDLYKTVYGNAYKFVIDDIALIDLRKIEFNEIDVVRSIEDDRFRKELPRWPIVALGNLEQNELKFLTAVNYISVGNIHFPIYLSIIQLVKIFYKYMFINN